MKRFALIAAALLVALPVNADYVKNVAATVHFTLLDATDGSVVTSGTPVIVLTKDGGTQAAATNAAAHEGGGQWSLALTATELNATTVGVLITESGSVPVSLQISTITLGTGGFADQTTAAAILDDTGTSGVLVGANAIGAGQIAADAIGSSEIATDAIGSAELAASAIGNSEIATSAFTLDRFSGVFPSNFPSLGINASGHVSRVTLADTITTYTGNTVQTGDSFARIGATGSGLTSLASQASVNTVDDFLDTEIAAILADTNELQTDWQNTGRLDVILDTLATDTSTLISTQTAYFDDIPTNAEFNARTLPTADYATATILAAVQGKLPSNNAKIAGEGTTAKNLDQIEGGGGGGTVIPVNQVPVPPSRTWKLSSAMIGDARRSLPIGSPQVFAIDFANDLAANGRVVDIVSVAIVSVDGEPAEEDEAGVTWSLADVEDAGVDRSLAKLRLTGVEAGEYELEVEVEYGPQDGGGNATGRVKLDVPD